MEGDNEFIEPPAELCDGDDNVTYVPKSLAAKAKFVPRNECTDKVSEFHVTPIDGKVELYDLIKKLSGDKVQHADLRKKLRRIDKREKVLEVPLNKHELEQITRVVQYEKTTKDVSLWEPIVQKNRKAEQLKFPLDNLDLKLHETIGEFVAQRPPRTQLQEQIAAVLKQSQPVIDIASRPLSKTEEAALRAMNLEEARLKRAELQKDRARAAFVAAKMKLQGKIKSKKYHRVQRRAKNKQEKKKLEQLSADDPEAYQEFVQKAEKQRIQERMSLRHKGTSRFMQRQTRYGKFDMKSRQSVQDMLHESQMLRQKATAPTELDDGLADGNESDSDVGEELIHESTTRKRTLDDLEDDSSEDGMNTDQPTEEQEEKDDEVTAKGREAEPSVKKLRTTEARIDPSRYLVLEKDVRGSVTRGDGLGLEAGTGGGLALAFAGDEDVVAEFAAEKRAVVERERPKDIDLRLPGWGDWSGPGLTMSKRHKKRFIVKAPAGLPRKDHQLDNVIISESKDVAITKHQVSSLPHPFRNVHDFERRITQPVGRQWNAVATFKKRTKPKVVTRLGTVIAPIDKAETFKKENLDRKQLHDIKTGKNKIREGGGKNKNGKNKNVKNSAAKK